MKLSPDDPKLTAYALGELDAAERAAIETALADSPEARAAVEEIRATVGRLTSELAAEPCPELTPEQCAVLASAVAKVVPFPTRRVWRTVGTAAAAACVLGVASWVLFRQEVVNRDAKFETTRVTKRELYSAKPSAPNNQVTPAAPNARVPGDSSNQPIPAAILNGTGFSMALFSGSAEKDALLEPPVFARDSSFIASTSPAVDQTVELLNESQTAQKVPSSTPGTGFTTAEAPSGVYSVNRVGIDSYRDAEESTSKRIVTVNKPWAGVGFGGGGFGGGGDAPVILSGDAGLPTGANPAAPMPPPVAGWTFRSDDRKRGDRPAEYASASSAGWKAGGSGFAPRLQPRVNRSGVTDGHTDYVPTPIVAYAPFIENAFVPVLQEPLSTFSIDVDTASYANVRRFLNSGQLPPRDAVRIEELVNYFSYAYAAPRGEDPFSANIETAGCPWAPEHRLVRVALRGRELPRGKRPPSNFVFLIDVSGSMAPSERLPLLKQALRALVKKMGEGDRVAIVVYASEAGVKLQSTSCTEKEKILAVIDALEAGGSTNGGEGIQQAYTMARKNFIKGGVNRVLLCTDGDFNVGITDQNALVALVKENAATGVFLTTLGVGTDNYKDALMQRLADQANGNYHYLDTLEEASKVLVEQMNANLVTIAKDVKIQVEFNPAQVSAYRLIGYEKRLLHSQDFNNDRKDAGEIGAGHTVTAFYEIVPAGQADLRPVVDKLKYQSAVAPASYSEKGEQSKELLTLKLRYKQPDGDASKLIEFPHTDSGGSYGKASADFKFAASVASFGMILRDSEHKGSATFDTVLELAEEGKGADEGGWRAEFINLVKKAKGLRQ